MLVFIVMRGDDNVGYCPVVDAVRLTEEEAEAYVVKQEMLALASGDEGTYWTIVEEDMPLTEARDAVAASG